MSISEPKTNAQRGDVDHAFGFKSQPFPKKTAEAGTGTHKLLKGDICSKDPADTTGVAFIKAKDNSVKPFVIARGVIFSPTPNEYLLTDAQGNYVSALETDTKFSGVYDGQAVIEFAGTCQVGDGVMADPAGTGNGVKWDGSNEKERIGYYLGRPGYRTGEFLPGEVTTGQLGWITVNE
jgi:hypothetical protein